jgi:hypothetical protein
MRPTKLEKGRADLLPLEACFLEMLCFKAF